MGTNFGAGVIVSPVTKAKSKTQIFLVSGDDESRIGQEASRIFRELAGENPDEFSVDVIREDDRGPRGELIRDVMIALRTPSFMGGRKTVWLKNFSGFVLESAKDKNDEFSLGALAQMLANGEVDGDMCLVLSGAGCEATRPLAKAVAAAGGEIIWCRKPQAGRKGSREEMMKRILQEAQERGVQISSEAAEMLTDVLGCDTSLVSGELEKLCCYVGGGDQVVTPEAVAALSPGFCEQQAWSLADLVGKRDLGTVLSMVGKFLAQEKDPDEAARGQLRMLARMLLTWLELRLIMAENHLRTSMNLKDWWLNGLSAEQRKAWRAAKNPLAEYKSEWRAKFAADNALNYTPNELMDAICIVRDALMSTVESAVPTAVALENALAKIVPRQGVSR